MSEIKLTDSEMKYLESIGSVVKYPKGQIIFATGQKTNEVYFIKTGWVKIYRTSMDGRQVSVALRYPGDFIGLAEVLSDELEREYNAEAMDNVPLLIVWRDTFNKMLSQNPIFTARVLNLMGNRLREAQNTIHDFIINPVQGRLALVLENMALRSGIAGDGNIVRVRLRVTQEELSCIVGASRQTVSSLLTLFREDGCLEYEGREITSINLEKLRSWME